MTMRSVQALRESQPNVTLVERLIAAGIVSEQQLKRALREKNRRDRPLGEILVELGLISESVLRDTLGQLLGDDEIDLNALLPDPSALAMVPKALAERHRVLPIDYDPEAELLTLAVTEHFDLAVADDMSRSLDAGVAIATRIAVETEIRSAIRKFYDFELTIAGIISEIDHDETNILGVDKDVEFLAHPLNRLVNAIIFAAARRHASAIHFEPEFGFVRVRFRIDGVLTQILALHLSYWPGMAARLNAMFGLQNDSDRRTGEARISMMLGTRRNTLILSRQATLQGHHFVARLVAENQDVVPLEDLGLDSEALANLRLMMARPDGLILVVGPPGSGKTATLYSMLHYRSDESVSITALEDPVTHSMPLIRHTTVTTDDGLDQAGRLRSLLRQDFDVLMVSELDDTRSAELALRAAMSGRQVFTTLQARSALAALPRLRDLGLQPECMAGNVSGIVGQRLLRKLCKHCRLSYSPEPFERRLLGVDASNSIRLYREGACQRCAFLGYKGRLGIFEVIVVDEKLDGLIARGADFQKIHRSLSAAGLRELADAAVAQVLTGVTSLSEASRVVDLSARVD